MKYSRALVTGGAGFIGSHLVDSLVEQGVAVTVVDKAEPKYRNDKATYILRDIRELGLDEVFAAAQPEVVFHLAAHIDDRASVHDPVMNAEHNVLGSLRVLEAARLAGVKKVLFTSTCAVYGLTAKPPLKEKHLPIPLTPYAISKLADEKYLHFYFDRYALRYTALRLANVYGPRQDGSKESGAIAIFTDKLMKGEAPFINDDGETVRDYIHVSDVVSALILASDSDVVGVFNCGTKVGTSTRGVYKLIADQLGSTLAPIPRPEVRDAVKAVTLNSGLARKSFGWKPAIRLKKGLKQTLKWYKTKV
jgi:UDP-glucose 4-epimerase